MQWRHEDSQQRIEVRDEADMLGGFPSDLKGWRWEQYALPLVTSGVVVDHRMITESITARKSVINV